MLTRVPRSALIGVLVLAGCQGEETNETPTQTIQSEISLTPVASCWALEKYIEDTAVHEMRMDMGSWETSWLSGRGGVDEASTAPNDSAGSAGAGPQDFTKTNTQVEGVDEADFMKTDGSRIFALSGKKLYLAKSWPPEDLAIEQKVEIQGWPLEMFLDERGRVVVFSSWWAGFDGDQDVYCGPWGCGWNRAFTRITVVDTAGDNLSISREFFLPGSYASSRRIDGSVRVVLRDNFRHPDGVQYWPDDFRGDWERDRAAFQAAMARQMDENEAIIRARSLSDWLPLAYAEQDGRRQTIERACASFHIPNAPVRLGLTTVATLDLNASGSALKRTAVLGQVGEIYASSDALYLASPHWWWWPQVGQTTHTYLHKFDIRDPSAARYVGSGGVPGVLLDQFSMDEHLGYLRVATTVMRWTSLDDRWQVETSNRVGVLGEHQRRLVEVGAVTGLAAGESIQSARFAGDRGFVVTFERVDPLFTLDLANPLSPRVVGELKIPGFSTYLHPVDENHLLAIGVDLPDPGPDGEVDWSARAMKLSLFDVSNFAQPIEKYSLRVGTAYGWSEAGWNHKAFNWFPARNMLAIPFSDLTHGGRDYWGRFVSELRLFRVDVNRGLFPQGALRMNDLFIEHGYREWSWRYSPWIRRSVMADDYAYAISDAGIRVAKMSQPDQPVATALFDRFRSD